MPSRRPRPGSSRPEGPAVPFLVLAAVVLSLAACGPRADATAGERRIAAVGPIPAAGPVAGPGARPSPGCTERPSGPIPERVVVNGRERSVLARVPDGPSEGPRDLAIVFHGRTNDAAQVRRYVHLDEALPEAVIVYPRALPTAAGTFAWSAPGDPPGRLRDFALVDAIVEGFSRATCLDLERVFVVGHSLGASFANDVACRLGGRIRAVASVAGGLQGGACVGGAAALLLHHPEDRLVPIASGERVRDAFRAANGLAAAPAVPAVRPALAALGCVRHGGTGAEDPVVWCRHDDATGPGGRYYPHTWPDGAAAAIAAFFAGLP